MNTKESLLKIIEQIPMDLAQKRLAIKSLAEMDDSVAEALLGDLNNVLKFAAELIGAAVDVTNDYPERTA